MARIVLATSLTRWLPESRERELAVEAEAGTVAEALERVFAVHPILRDYVLDEHGRLRRHVAVFVDGAAIAHGTGLAAAVGADSEIYVIQALSGG